MTVLIAIKVETPLQDEIAALLLQSDLVAAQLYPGEYRRPITPESLGQPGTHVMVARLIDKAVGLCVIFERGSGELELKRMIVDAKSRGQGVGAALVSGVQAEARRLHAKLIMLEVGVHNTEAQALYHRKGFTDREPFSPYQRSAISLFMEQII